MTDVYRATELKNAREELESARSTMCFLCNGNSNASRSKRIAASEQVEFWGNKVAFLSAVAAE